MSNRWVRKNGQAELRENLRTAMRESGRSQRSIIDEAGVGYSHVIGGMNDNNWISVEAVEAIAAVLEIQPDELLGESIYKHERDRYAEYDHPSPEEQARRDKVAAVRAEAAGGEDRTRALCCTCGALRSASWAGGMEYNPRWDSYNHGRQLVRLDCVQCREKTRHAVILSATDEDRDAAEQFDHAPTREQESQRERDSLIARLASFGVDVHYRPRREKYRRDGFLLRYLWDEAKERWRIEVDPNAPARVQVLALENTWAAIAHDDHDVSWDPRDGVSMSYGSETWGLAADELLEDVQRFLDVERRRLVRDARDAALRAQFDSAPHDEEADR